MTMRKTANAFVHIAIQAMICAIHAAAQEPTTLDAPRTEAEGLTAAERTAAEQRKADLIASLEAELTQIQKDKVEVGKTTDREAMKRLITKSKALRTQLLISQKKDLEEYHKEIGYEREAAVKAAAEAAEAKKNPPRKWYEGGTLHRKNGLDWQTASQADQLATCADFVIKAKESGLLKDRIVGNIQTIEDARPYAKELCDCLNNAFAPEPNPTTNAKLYTNQNVSDFAALGMATMRWLK